MSALGKLRALRPGDRALLLRAWPLLFVADVGLRVLPFSYVRRLFKGGATAEAPPVDDQAAAFAGRVGEMVGIAARHHLYGMSCLPRSLVVVRLLRARGVGATLRIGVKRQEEELQAHAWVEVGGRSIGNGGPSAEAFRPLG